MTETNEMNEGLTPEHIDLRVVIEARYSGTRIAGPCYVHDEIILVLPQMESKFVNFPKIMEGAVNNIIDAHLNKVRAEKVTKAKEDAQEKERAKARRMGLVFAEDEN